MSQQSSGNPSLRFGALFGVIWGAVLVANFYVEQVLDQKIPLSGVIVLLISLGVYLVAGMLAASKTGTVPTGLLAGLFTGLFSGVINAIGVAIFVLTDSALVTRIQNQLNQAAQSLGSSNPNPYTPGLVIGIEIGGSVLGLGAAIVVGLGVGALGGVIGKARAPVQLAQPYQEAMYPGYPPAGPYGAPGYPPATLYGAPGYPQYPQGQMPGAYPPPPPVQGAWPQQPAPPVAYPPPPERYMTGQESSPPQPQEGSPPQGPQEQ